MVLKIDSGPCAHKLFLMHFLCYSELKNVFLLYFWFEKEHVECDRVQEGQHEVLEIWIQSGFAFMTCKLGLYLQYYPQDPEGYIFNIKYNSDI